LDAAIWFATGFDRDTGERLEDILDNLPRQPVRKPKSTWPEMSTTEKLGHIADRGSDIFDEVFDVVGNWGVIRLGSVAFVVWIVGLMLFFFGLTFTLIGRSSLTVSTWDIDSERRQFGDSEGTELTL